MKVQHDTGWLSFINKALIEKSVDKPGETNPELSQYSSISTVTNVWTSKHLWQRKIRRKTEKRHRFPPSLLSSRAVDFWNTLMPLRANCSCSSVSIVDKCSRLSFDVSSSDASLGSNSDCSVSAIKETPARGSLGDTLEHTHLAFESLIARMLGLLNTLNKNSGSSSSHVSSGSNPKILPQGNSKSKENEEMIAPNGYSRFPSITSLSDNSSHDYSEHWSAGKTGKKWESSSKFEIAERKKQFFRRGKGFFPRTILVPKTSRVPKSLLAKEELVYLLQNKKSLLSEYFQRKEDSIDLKKDLNSCDRETFICGTQSDSRLQEHSLHQFVQFIRARRKSDAEDLLKKNFQSPETYKLNTEFADSNEEESHHLLTPKRRVTFSDPLSEDSTTFLNCYLTHNGNRILSAESFSTTMNNNSEIPLTKFIHSDDLDDSKTASPSDSSLSLKTCSATLSLNTLCTKTYDLNPDFDKFTTEQTVVCQENITDKRLGTDQSECHDEFGDITEKNSMEKANVVSVMSIEKFQPHQTKDISTELSSSALPDSLQKFSKSDSVEDSEMIEGETPREVKFLMEEYMLDCATTDVPIADDTVQSMIPDVDDATARVTPEQCSSQRNFDKCLKRKIRSMKVHENCDPVDDETHTSNYELKSGSMKSKVTRFGNIQQTEISVKLDQPKLTKNFSTEQKSSDTDLNHRPSLPSTKTVTFQDCCQTLSDRSIIADQKEPGLSLDFDGNWVSSSESKGRFELSWKGCWDQQSTTNFVRNTERLAENFTEDEERLLESNPTETAPESILFTPIKTEGVETNLFSSNHEPFSGSQTSYYATMENEIQSKNNSRSKHRSGSLGATSPLSYSHLSNRPSFTAVAASLEKENDEIIPWTVKPQVDQQKHFRPASKFNYSFDSNPETIELRNHSEARRGLGNVYEGIRNPEIWRAEVRSEAPTFNKSDKYSWKSPEIRSDWLIRKLKELQTNPETDYESDYCAESEMESDFEWERDLSLVKRSFSNLDAHSKKYRKFRLKRNRFGPGSFLNNVWPGKKIIFNECRCHKNTPINTYDPRSTERDLKHTSCQGSDQRSNQNFFSHLRARLIVDSETDDSEFSPSIQPEFSYNFNRRNEHVNKIKCRRFVRSLRSIKSEEDRRLSSARLLDVTFRKSFSPANVRGAVSTRTVGTNVSEKHHCCTTMDVCIDTNDLCSRKRIRMTNRDSDLSLFNKNSSSQTVETFIGTSSMLQSTGSVPQTCQVLSSGKTEPPESNLQISKNSEERISNVIANLSAQINNASNNLAKLRFSEIETMSEKAIVFPVTEENDSSTDSPLESCQASIQQRPIVDEIPRPIPSIPLSISSPLETFPYVESSLNKSNNVLNNSDSHNVEEASCSICNTRKKPNGRYALPACIVKGAGPDPQTNEKDPWNRVMERAKAQRRDEGRNISITLDMKPSRLGSSATQFLQLEVFERKHNSVASDELCKEEARIQLVQVKNQSSQAAVCALEHPTITDKIPSPPRKYRPLKLPPTSQVCFSTSSYFPVTTMSLPRTRSPRRIKKPQAVPNMSNRLLYIISEKAELAQQTLIRSPVANFFT